MRRFTKEIWNRIAKNWRTSSVAIIAGAVIVARWQGYIVSGTEIITVLAAIEALILLFAKDK